MVILRPWPAGPHPTSSGCAATFLTTLDNSTSSPDGLAALAEENSALIDNALDLMVVFDPDGRVLRANAAARALLGYEPCELVGLHFNDLIHPEQHAQALHVEDGLRTRDMARPDIVVRARRRDGREIQQSVAARWSEAHQRTFVIARDVTGQQEARAALERSEAALNSMLESIGDAFFAIDGDWRLTYANQKAGDFVGVDAAGAIGHPLLEIAPELLQSDSLSRYQLAMASRQPDTFETFWVPRQVWLEVRVYPHADGISVYFHEITARHEAEHRLRKSEQRFRKLFNQAGDSIMIVDGALRIVAVNDQACARFGYRREEFQGMLATDVNFGFAEGRALLAGLRAGQAQLLRTDKRCKDGSVFPAEVQISRFDDEGEEFFLAVIRDVSERAEAERRLHELATHDTLTGLPNRALLGERVQQMLDACPYGSQVAVMFLDLDRFKEVNDSFGHDPQDARTREILFQTADTAMYRAKNAGRNRYRFFEPEMTVATQARMALEVSLRPALARGEFELHYQPRYALCAASPGGIALYGMEALIRWNHPERGQVPPQQFIGIAEETGLIVGIGRWVLEEACLRTRELMKECGGKVVVSVNVSARQLAQAAFAAEVREILERTGLRPDCLELELTESALIEDIEHTAAVLRELKRLGVKLAVDDFGTGYSSLAYLRRFPIDVLKLDRSFLMQQDENVATVDFVKAFVDMAHALGMAVVAEGVETAEVLAFLRAAHCDQAQGYYLARPMPLARLRALVGGHAAMCTHRDNFSGRQDGQGMMATPYHCCCAAPESMT